MAAKRALDDGKPPRRPVTVRVTGPRPVGGARRGEVVSLVLSEDQEAALIEGGHIERAVEPDSPPPPPPAPEPEPGPDPLVEDQVAPASLGPPPDPPPNDPEPPKRKPKPRPSAGLTHVQDPASPAEEAEE